MLTLNDVANASRHHVVKLSIPDADGGVPLLAALKSSSRHFREQALPARTSVAATAAGAPPRVRRVRAYSGPGLENNSCRMLGPTRPRPGEPDAFSPCNPHRTSRGSSCRPHGATGG